MNESPLLQPILAGVIAVLLLAGVIGVATVDDDSETLTASGATTTTLSEGDAGDDGEAGADLGAEPTETTAAAPDGVPATTVAPSATTAPARATTTAAPAAKEPGPAQPPKVGLYRYRTVENGETKQAESRVERDPEQVPGETRILDKFKEEAGSSELTNAMAWRADGVYLRKTTFPSPAGGAPITCDWEPDVLQAKLPIKAGQEWTFDSSCKADFAGNEATFHMTGKSKVVGARRVTVAGQALDTWLFDETLRLEINTTYNGQPIRIVSDTVATAYVSPPHGLQVKGTEDTTTTGPNGKPQQRKSEREILNLDPA